MSYRQALNIGDLERLARKRLPASVFGFIAGGVQDNLSLANNRAGADSDFTPAAIAAPIVTRRAKKFRLLASIKAPS